MQWLERTYLLIEKEKLDKLANKKIWIFGVGGVGGYAAMGLIRSGASNIVLIDNDTVSVSNINRQIVATQNTVGRLKVEVMKEMMLEINPNASIDSVAQFYNADTVDMFAFGEGDYIIDAIDTITSKLLLIKNAKDVGASVISCMGTGNKLDPTRLVVADIADTSICPLARTMRKLLKREGISQVKVIYSTEMPKKPDLTGIELPAWKKQVPASCSFVPSVAGLIIAGEVVKDVTDCAL